MGNSFAAKGFAALSMGLATELSFSGAKCSQRATIS
jgi:hypothetical protein